MIAQVKGIVRYILKNKLILVLVIAAFILTLMPIVFDGQYGCVKNKCGFIIGTNYRDGVWYLAVAAAAFKTIPFRMPIYSGETLRGYHYLPNLISYLLTFIGIPITVSFYKLFPVVYMIFLTSLATKFARSTKDNSRFVAAFLFFTFFGIPLSAFLSLFHQGKIDNTMVLISTFQATRILESIHVALSFLILLVVLIIIHNQKLNTKKRLFLGLTVFVTFGTKFYEGIILLFLLWLNETFLLTNERKLFSYLFRNLIYGVAAFSAILIFYNPFASSEGGSIFIWAPFVNVHHLIETPILFYNLNLVNARYFLYTHGWSPRLFFIEGLSTLLYVIYYFGARVIGFIYIAKQIITRKITRFETLLAITIVFGIGISVFFIQRGDWFNPMQFAACAAFLINIFAAKALFELFQRKKLLTIIMVVIIVFITFFPNLVNLTYLNNYARYIIPKEEMVALDFLKDLPDGTIFAPIYGADSPYIPAFTGKQIYIGFMNVIENTAMPSYKQREEVAKNVDKLNVEDLNVNYIYIPYAYEKYQVLLKKCLKSKKYKQIFINKAAAIFEKII